MDPTVIVALIGAGTTIGGVVLGRVWKKRDEKSDLTKRVAALEAITKNIEAQNLCPRLSAVEQSLVNANLPALLKLTYLNTEEKLKSQANQYLEAEFIWSDQREDWLKLYECCMAIRDTGKVTYLMVLHDDILKKPVKYRSHENEDNE